MTLQGIERYKEIRTPILHLSQIDYSYQHVDGSKFICIKSTLEKAREACRRWLIKREREIYG